MVLYWLFYVGSPIWGVLCEYECSKSTLVEAASWLSITVAPGREFLHVVRNVALAITR